VRVSPATFIFRSPTDHLGAVLSIVHFLTLRAKSSQAEGLSPASITQPITTSYWRKFPGFYGTEQHRDLKVVVHNSAPDYIRDILALISKLLDFSCEVVFTDTDVLQIPSYVFTQAEAYSGFVHGDDLLLLRKHLLKETTKRCHADKKIYLTRRNASRSFANEEQVAELMMNKGYDVVIPETMDFSSQIALSQDASVVVAPHGAGLANLLWCHPGTKIVEIFSPLYFNDCYARLSAQLKLPYRPLWAREGKGWGSVDLNKLAMTLDTLG